MESALRAAVSERLGATRFGLWFGESVRLGILAEKAMRWKSECPIPSSASGSRITIPPACSKQPRQFSAGRCNCQFAFTTRSNRRWEMSLSRRRLVLNPSLNLSSAQRCHYSATWQSQSPFSFLSRSPDLPAPPLPPPPTDRPQLSQTYAGCTLQWELIRYRGPASRRLRRLEDFVTGPGNRLAHAAAIEMAHSAGASL